MYATILLILNVLILTTAYKSYENYKVYKVIPESDTQLQILTDLKKSGFDIWTEVPMIGKDVRILVSPAQENDFVDYMKGVGLGIEVAIKNVQSLINDQRKPSTPQRSSLGSFTWTVYHTLDKIHEWLDELETMYPNIVRTVTIGNGTEGRAIKGVIIDYKSGQRENPLIGMIEGGIHAREWISPATVTGIIKEFLTSDNTDVRFMAEAFVSHIFPVVNTDGYDYTFTNNRMWRKNRNTLYSTACGTDDDLSNGIDLNRNFDYVWNSKYDVTKLYVTN
ncbi:zinc carboxypeptidase A 1 [Pieris rapae]|uniref:zinc carboxypeptidase A 1 n=1 Tax=Pieris rapae TaxID=64459 RepID=UPI001E27F9B7|nr:zinc carboxypeptidase A 1 [Pieris rapae]